ncbi:MAG: hypothetical protein ACE5H9_07590 [Anaerolineae bacterium]
MTGPVDFATVQYARKMSAAVEALAGLSPTVLRSLAAFIHHWAGLKEAGVELTPQQLQVIFQGLHSKDLVRLEAVKGGVQVEFSGGGFEYERFLLRQDGRMPNHRYEAKKAGG